MKNWKQSKTIIFNVIVGMLAILPMIDIEFLTSIGIQNPLSYYKVLVVITAVMNQVLRVLTNTGIK